MIDIHSHILPGLDDGSQSMEETLAMLKMAAADGITGIVATPHVNNSIYPNSKETIIAKVEEVNRLLQSEHIPISVFPGAEIRLEPDLPERMAKKELLTINNTGSYLLIELPAEFIPTYTEQSLYELQLQGVIPIIAHPERCSGFHHDPARLTNLVAKGILLQITTGSIIGLFGNKTRKTALRLINRGYAHFIGSDAHSAGGVRKPLLSAAYGEIKKLYDIKTADCLAHDNPGRALEGQQVQTLAPRRYRGNFLLRLMTRQ